MTNIVHNIDYRLFLDQNKGFKCDIVLSDIPYGINAGNMPYVKQDGRIKQKNGRVMVTPKKHYGNEDWDVEVPKQDYYDLMKAISSNQIIFGIEYADWLTETNGRLKWNKGVAEGMSFKSYELAYCSFIDNQDEIDYLWSGMMQGKSHLEPMVMQGNKKKNEKRIHPTQKPIILYYMILEKYAKPGMVIFDSHVGSGSLRIACDIFGCHFVGCEINKNTFDKQEARYTNFKHKLF